MPGGRDSRYEAEIELAMEEVIESPIEVASRDALGGLRKRYVSWTQRSRDC